MWYASPVDVQRRNVLWWRAAGVLLVVAGVLWQFGGGPRAYGLLAALVGVALVVAAPRLSRLG